MFKIIAILSLISSIASGIVAWLKTPENIDNIETIKEEKLK